MQIRTQHRPNLRCIARGRSARAFQLCPSRGSTLESRSSRWLATLRTPSPSRSKPAGRAWCRHARNEASVTHGGVRKRAGGKKGERSAPPYPRPLSTASTSCALPRPTPARLCPRAQTRCQCTVSSDARNRRPLQALAVCTIISALTKGQRHHLHLVKRVLEEGGEEAERASRAETWPAKSPWSINPWDRQPALWRRIAPQH